MYKQSTATKIFKRTFPHIEVDVDTISDDSLIEIFKSIDPCINFDNPDMRKWASDFGNVVCAKSSMSLITGLDSIRLGNEAAHVD